MNGCGGFTLPATQTLKFDQSRKGVTTAPCGSTGAFFFLEAPVEQISYIIKYDRLVAGEHSMDLGGLGESLQGFSKILGVAGDFVSHGRYTRKYSDLSVHVVTDGKFAEGSLEVTAVVIGILPELFSGLAGSMITALVSYLLSRKTKEDMNRFADALDKAIEAKKLSDQQAELRDRQAHERELQLLALQKQLMDVVQQMGVSLGSATREALAPVGKSCGSVSLHSNGECVASIDPPFKEEILAKQSAETFENGSFSGILTALDRETGACKIAPVDEKDETRTPGIISDPALQVAGNAYLRSFVEGRPISFQAKAVLNKDGDPVKFYIAEAELKN